MKNALTFLETWHNRASDSNWVWFPFLFLKPQPQRLLDLVHVSKMTVCFALYFNAAYLGKRWLWGQTVDMSTALWSQVYWAIGFFLWFNAVTAFFWNRRARRLSIYK